MNIFRLMPRFVIAATGITVVALASLAQETSLPESDSRKTQETSAQKPPDATKTATGQDEGLATPEKSRPSVDAKPGLNETDAAPKNDFLRRPTAGATPVAAKRDRIDIIDLLLIETADGIACYSKPLGKWDRVVVAVPKDGSPRLKTATVGFGFAAVVIDDQLLGFSSKCGRWGKLTISPEYVGTVSPMIGVDMVSVKIGGQTYALSPTTAEWVSLDTPPASTADSPSSPEADLADLAENVDVGHAENRLRAGIDNSDSRRLTEQLATLESRAANLADQIRSLNQALQHFQSVDQKIVQARRDDLNTTLAQAFDLKYQLEQLRVKELNTRLTRLEREIGRRQSQRAQIIERRARELIEGNETDWNGDQESSTKTESSGNAQDGNQSAGDESEIPATSKRSEQLKALEQYKPEPSTSRPNPAAASAQKDATTSDSRDQHGISNLDPLPSYKTMAMDLEVTRAEIESAKTVLANTERLYQHKVVSKNEVEIPQQRLNTAERKYQILQKDLAATLNDLEIRLNSAIEETKSEGARCLRFEQLHQARAIDERLVDEAKHRLNQAQLAEQRLSACYELFRNIDGVERLNRSEIDGAHPANADQPLLEWGMVLAPIPESERHRLGKTRHQGGMLVLEVVPSTPAAEQGIRKGDFLVGLSRWETKNLANLRFIRDYLKKQKPTKEQGTGQIPFIVVRDGEERTGQLPSVALPETPPKKN